MLGFLTVVASLLYLAPLAGLVLLARRADDDALDLACALPLVFAADLLGTFVLCYVFPVDKAAFVRTIGIAVAVALVATRRALRGRPILRGGPGLSAQDALALAVAGAAALYVSWRVSGHAWVSDREWHTPFVSALRVQRMPFRNVYEPGLTIRYHLSGDLSSAVLQALSFGSMNAARALSVAHDLQSALLVGTIALFFRAFCPWRPAVAGLAALVPFLTGPMGLRVGGMGMYEGYADFSNFVLSFRPHAMVSLVLLAGIACQLVRLARGQGTERPPRWGTLVALVPLYALLGITDEISAAACGLMLGLSWLLWPRLFGPARWHGAVVLIALAAAILLANRFLAGTIAAGGPVEHAHWMPPRIPHFFGPPLPFRDRSDWEAWWQLFVDEGTLLLPAAVLAFSLLRDRRWNDPLAVLAVFGMGAMVLGLAEYLSLEVNGRTYEGHRFMTAARILIPLAALAWAPRLPRASLRSIALLAPICVGAVAAVGFVYARFAVKMDARGGAAYDAECRTEYGARLGERIVPTYVDEPIWYPYAGCRPIFAAGHDGPPGVVLAGWAKLGPAGFAKMDHGEVFTRGAPARVVCAADPAARTPFCQRAVGLGPCRPAGTRAIACEIPPEARPALEH